MAANHPIHIHPARPLYRFTATALGASMWFFVRLPVEYLCWRLCWFRIFSDVQLMYRAKKDGPALLGLKHPWDHWNAIHIAFLSLHDSLISKNWRHIILVILSITQWASIVSWGFMLYIQLVILSTSRLRMTTRTSIIWQRAHICVDELLFVFNSVVVSIPFHIKGRFIWHKPFSYQHIFEEHFILTAPFVVSWSQQHIYLSQNAGKAREKLSFCCPGQ